MIEICLDAKDENGKLMTLNEYSEQWDTLLQDAADAPSSSSSSSSSAGEYIKVRLECGGVSCEMEIDVKTLYLRFAGDEEEFRYVGSDEVQITSKALSNAVYDIHKHGTKADRKSKVLAIFAVSEAARFDSFRKALYWVIEENLQFSWLKLLPMMRLWMKILGKTEPITPIFKEKLEEYIASENDLTNVREIKEAMAYLKEMFDSMEKKEEGVGKNG